MGTPSSPSEFDSYAADYDAALSQGISVSGEDKAYFAKGRVIWLAGCLNELGIIPKSVLDYGCGTGSAAAFLFDLLGVKSLMGLDPSAQSLATARQAYADLNVSFLRVDEYLPSAELDLAFCNGVFHHILPAERSAALKVVIDALRPGGLFSFWENNPWNPGTRWVMSRIPFDRDAVTLSPPGARKMLEIAGFEILRTDFLFIFPRALSWLRRFEPILAKLPFGAQYQILCRKP